MHQGRIGNKVTGAYEFTEAIKGYYTTEDKVISTFYTVYIQKDSIWMVLGSLDDYFVVGLICFLRWPRRVTHAN